MDAQQSQQVMDAHPPQSSKEFNTWESPKKALIMVTADSETYLAVDVTGIENGTIIRGLIYSRLRIPNEKRGNQHVYRTEIGEGALGDPVTDDQFVFFCKTWADPKGSLKFLVQGANSEATAPHSKDLPSPPAPAAVTHQPNDELNHGIDCNACGKNILGVRYQCANCASNPTAYSLCAECERDSFTQHPLPHVFLKFTRRVDNPVRRMAPLIPIVYEVPADGNFIANLEVKEAKLVHDSTFCDLCMTPIHGEWYRCCYCSTDLCDVHAETHDPDHVFLVFKAKTSIWALGEIFNFDNPSRNVPLIEPVYEERV